MKFVSILLIICLLCGCSTANNEMQQVTAFRQKLLTANSCAFDTVITADYENVVYTFQMNCQMDSNGSLEFIVTQPNTISGVSGTVNSNGGFLTFDDEALAFPVLADGQAAPVTAPWIFLTALRGGYITGCYQSDDAFHISVDDSYEENPLHLEITTDSQFNPFLCEIYWNGYRILTLDIKSFEIQ